jgi:hypothetical protein
MPLRTPGGAARARGWMAGMEARHVHIPRPSWPGWRPSRGGYLREVGVRCVSLRGRGRGASKNRMPREAAQHARCSVAHHWLAQQRVVKREGEVNAPCFGMGMFENVVKGGGCLVGKAWSGCELNTAHTRVWLFACHCDLCLLQSWFLLAKKKSLSRLAGNHNGWQ